MNNLLGVRKLKMLITSFSIQNFRSIKEATGLPIYNLSILIGPNNEGKSNILQALVLTLRYLSDIEFSFGPMRFRRVYTRRHRLEERTGYSWRRDFPIKSQEKNPNGKSVFIIESELSKQEKYNFKRLVKIKLKGQLRIKLSLGKDQPTIRVFDTSNPKKSIPCSISKLNEFIDRNLLVQYIGAIRTSDTTTDIIDDMISSEISLLQRQKSYKELLDKLGKKQKPILDKLSKSLTESVSSFLPDVKKIELDYQDRLRRIAHESCNVSVDDGTKTDLALKGDGIKSLLAISIIQHTTQQSSLDKNIILAIEEPESHLHPDAIHRLRKVLENISSKNQVIITTHSPLLINRAIIKKNILVYKSKAIAAENIADVRKLLGVQVSDNLHCANLIILVEGQEDISILKAWLTSPSKKIKSALNEGKIAFDHLNGCTNLSYKITQYKSLLCDVFAFLDGDSAAEKAFQEAESKELISEKEVCFAKMRGFKEAEIEDMVEISVYKKIVEDKYGVKLEGNIFRNNKKKWSDRVKATFYECGKRWPKGRETEIKQIVAEEVSKKEIKSLKNICKPCINTVVEYIENYINQ